MISATTVDGNAKAVDHDRLVVVANGPKDAPVTFEQSLAAAAKAGSLPPPGPDYYAARRALWLTPAKANTPQRRASESSSSRDRLECIFRAGTPDDEAWRDGVQRVWKGLMAGGRLKKRLPMNLVMKIIHSGWQRDPEIWPAGMVAPDSDEELDESIIERSSKRSSGLTSAWSAPSRTMNIDQQLASSRR